MSNQPQPNKITGANAGGPHSLPIRTRRAARIAQLSSFGGIHQAIAMARRSLKVAALVVAVLVAIAWVAGHSSGRAPRAVQRASLIGFTNGLVGPIAAFLSGVTTNNALSMEQWFGAGTNGALFRITNIESSLISVFPTARFYRKGSEHVSDQAPLLNASNFSGIFLNAGQVATVQVAVLPHQGPWKVVFTCHRLQSKGLFERLGTLPRAIGSMLSGTPIVVQKFSIESDWVTP